MIRKRCKHGAGMRGPAVRKAWRQCGCTWGADLTVDGRKVWHNLGTDEHAARVRELRLRADIAEGRRGVREAGVGVADQVKDWLAHKEAQGARVQSLQAWRSRGDHLTRYFGDLPVDQVDLRMVQRFVEAFRVDRAPATVNGVLAALGSVLTHARVQNGIRVPTFDWRGVRLPTKPRTHHLTVEECRLVVAEAPEPWASLLEVALLTGLRKGELLALTVGDVERDRSVLHVRGTLTGAGTINPPKTRSGQRAVTLSPRAHTLLHDLAEKAVATGVARLWPYRLGDADKALRAVLESLGLHRPGRGWHSFRHAHTALLNEAGVSLRDAASRLGHGANTAQSMQYGWAAEHEDAAVIDAAVTRHHPATKAGG